MQLLKETLKLLFGCAIVFGAIPLYLVLLVGNIWLTFNVNGLVCIITAIASMTAIFLMLSAGITIIVEANLDEHLVTEEATKKEPPK